MESRWGFVQALLHSTLSVQTDLDQLYVVIALNLFGNLVRKFGSSSFHDPQTGEPHDNTADQDHHPRILTLTNIAIYEPLPPSWSKEKLPYPAGGQFIFSLLPHIRALWFLEKQKYPFGELQPCRSLETLCLRVQRSLNMWNRRSVS